MWRILRNLVILVAVAAGLCFGFLNDQEVKVDYIFGEMEVPLVLVLITVFVVGFALSMLIFLARVTALSGRLRRTSSRLEDAQGEIRNLRNMPIHDA